MVRWLRWHCPPDTGFEIRALAVWGRARYLSVASNISWMTFDLWPFWRKTSSTTKTATRMGQRLINVWPTSNQRLTNVWPTSTSDLHLTSINVCPTSDQSLIKVWPTSDQRLTNVWPTPTSDQHQRLTKVCPTSDQRQRLTNVNVWPTSTSDQHQGLTKICPTSVF